jgi:hypothetical protein
VSVWGYAASVVCLECDEQLNDSARYMQQQANN